MDEDAAILRYRCRDGRLGHQYYSFANVWPPLIFIEVCAAAALSASHGAISALESSATGDADRSQFANFYTKRSLRHSP